MTNKNEYYYRDGNFILCNDGTPWKAKGNGIYTTAMFAMFHNDYTLLGECKRLLVTRRRWPRRLDNPGGLDYMNPRQMFRADYVAFYMACIEMEREHWIKDVRPPWYLFKPSFNAWRRFLINTRTHQKRRYEFWTWADLIYNGPSTMQQTFDLSLMAWTARSESAMKLHGAQVPEWHLACRQLTNHPMARYDADKIKKFVPSMGFIWHWETSDPRHRERILLPLFQEYLLDYDSLLFFFERNTGKR